ncbi:MAG: hypothetical protein Q8O09_05085, partial [Bacillota bacterium]|nr:hypothetical protein [Bacillota bacterium]
MLTHGRKLSSIVLVLLLICTAVSVSTPQNALAATDEPQKVREITELRESDSKTYQLSDGTYEWVGYPEDVHYLDQNGDYQDISNSIILENKKIGDVDYGYKNKANKYTVRFATNASDANLVMMDYQDKSIAFGLVDTKASNAVKTEKIDSKILSDMVDTQSCVEYKDIYQDVDLMYESKTYGVKEYIILNQPTDKNEFYFNIMLDGLTVKEDNGNVIFVDKNGKTVFEAGKLFAVDNNGAVTEDVKCVAMENNGSYQLKVTVDKSYLADANRAYPIIIDPSVMITGSSVTFDSYVSSRNGDANYYLSDYI